MILTSEDLAEFERAVEALEATKGGGIYGEEAERAFLEWIVDNPQVIFAAGFSEYLACPQSPLLSRYNAVVRILSGEQASPLFRQNNGRWIWLANLLPDVFHAHSVEQLIKEVDHVTARLQPDDDWLFEVGQAISLKIIEIPNAEKILKSARRYVDNPLVDPTSIVSPRLWTPRHQEAEKRRLQETTIRIMRHLREQRFDLRTISWRDYEDIVAEVLRFQGMEIHVVRETPQGGRDIVARGELIPGLEPVTIAVEVKHRDTVDRPEVQKALFQNRYFPALLFVTSGRFTAGVFAEARKPENRMRLILKDGVAMRDLLKSYALGGARPTELNTWPTLPSGRRGQFNAKKKEKKTQGPQPEAD